MRNGLANATDTHDANTRARDFARQWHGPAGPFAVFDVEVCSRQLARGAEHQANRQISDVVVQYLGSVCDHHIARFGGGDIDAVIANAEHRDDF